MERADLLPHTAWLRDPTGAMTVAQAQASSSWHPSTGRLNEGFTHDAIWLRIQIDRPVEAPPLWILEFNNGDLADLRVYERSANGIWREHQAGEDIPQRDWDLAYRVPLFRLDLKEPGPHTYWVRITSRCSLSAQVRLWRPQSFDAGALRESMAYGWLFGAYATIFIFHLFFWRWAHEEVSRWYACYVANGLCQMILTFGHFQWWTGMPGWLCDKVLAVLICSAIWIGINMCVLFMGLQWHMPRTARALTRLSACLSVVFGLLAVGVNYATGVAPAQLSILALIIVLVAIAIRLCKQGHRQAFYFLLAFGIYFIAIVVRILRNFTVLPPNFVTDNGFQIGAIIHMLVMSITITQRHNTLKQKKLEAQTEALLAKNEYAAALESEVDARTASLVTEIERRKTLEDELRQALIHEQLARQEQRDFVAMVSHEFRTPLSIIDISAQRLIASSTVAADIMWERCKNIRQAVQRMTALMNEFLSMDRIEDDLRALALTNVDPRLLLQRVVDELHQQRIRIVCAHLPPRFCCDAELLRIAIHNLLSNAIRNAPAETDIRLSAVGLENGIVIEVADQGKHIPADELPRLFQKYFRGRAAKSSAGTGLGLYLVMRIVKQHHGQITVVSEPGLGNTFSLSLPDQSGSSPQ
jgi:signal transduction histidine kinase